MIIALKGCQLHAGGFFLVFPIVSITNNAASESKSRKLKKKCKLKSRLRGCGS